jgi:hypothetical protein
MRRSRTKARTRALPRFPVSIGLGSALLALLLLWAVGARAQISYPRVGLSASPTEYINTLVVGAGEEFTLYAVVLGPTDDEPIGQGFTSLSWVIHQVCCGAEIDVLDVQFDPGLEHTGHPLVGVQTTADSCYDQDRILLATMTSRLSNPTPGGVLWAAGPFDASMDCDGGNALFMGLAVTINVDGGVSPTEGSRWGSIKAMYR